MAGSRVDRAAEDHPQATAAARSAQHAKGWTFLTNHAHVLLAIARDPTTRLRDVADTVGITERGAQAIVADLEAAGYLRRERVGRRNQYTVNTAGRFRHPAEADHRIGDLLALFTGSPGT
jgi:DNA-binding MarR family transcriptional regulator